VTLSSDRRNNKRYHFETIILHDTLLPDIFYDAKMYDIGEGGVYFESDQSLYPGEEIYIGLKGSPYSENTEKYFSHIRIKWRKDLTDGSFKFGYGAEFIKASGSLLKILMWLVLEMSSLKTRPFKKKKIHANIKGNPTARLYFSRHKIQSTKVMSKISVAAELLL